MPLSTEWKAINYIAVLGQIALSVPKIKEGETFIFSVAYEKDKAVIREDRRGKYGVTAPYEPEKVLPIVIAEVDAIAEAN